jgi:hypothetical protein
MLKSIPILCPQKKVLLVSNVNKNNIMFLDEFLKNKSPDGGAEWGPYWNIILVLCQDQYFGERRTQILNEQAFIVNNASFIDELRENLYDNNYQIDFEALASILLNMKNKPKN